MKDETFRVVVAGGGSGGHVYPTLAILEALQKKCEELQAPLQIIRMGPHDGYGVLFQNLGAKLSPVTAGKMRRYWALANIIDIPKLFLGFLQALFKLYFIMPDVLFSKGGTGALPVVLAAWFYRIPIAIHESDAQPGLTNLFSARVAAKVFVSFNRAAGFFASNKVIESGTPLRKELLGERTSKELAKENLGFQPKDPLILILGGSQGSQRINDFVLTTLPALVKEAQVLHQTGVANFAEVQRLARAALISEEIQNRYKAVGYFEKDLALALTAADLALTRAGSGTLSELAAFGLPAVVIPLSDSANDHQRLNAYEFSNLGAGVVLEEANLLPGLFLEQVKNILRDDALRAKMSEASGKFFKPNAAEVIAQALLTLGAEQS